jgi:hypothetical protein
MFRILSIIGGGVVLLFVAGVAMFAWGYRVGCRDMARSEVAAWKLRGGDGH